MEKHGKQVLFDIKNKQESYAAIYSLICYFEGEENAEKKCNDIEVFTHEIEVRVGKVPSDSINTFKSDKRHFVKQTEEYLSKYDSAEFNEDKGLFKAVNSMEKLKATRNTNDEYLYYLRIYKSDDEDVVSYQYLILLLQGLKKIHSRLICFFIPEKRYYSSNSKDSSLYFEVSHYLRTIRYNMLFGVFYNRETEKLELQRLTKRKKGIQSTFIPLIEINKESYKILSSRLSDESGDDELKSDLIEIGDRVAEKKDIKKRLIESINYHDVSVLQYLILCAILPDHVLDDAIDKTIESYMISSTDYSDGIFQLMENVVRYSQNHEGVFSFRLHPNNSTFIIENLGWKNESNCEGISKYLEVGIADFNVKENVIDNFLSKDIIRNNSIYKYKELIGIKDFFREHGNNDDLKHAWHKYHIDNRLVGMGLSRMKENADEHNAFLFAKSCKECKITDKKLVYCKDFNMGYKNDYKNILGDVFIPGTQYRLVFPVLNKAHNVVYNSDYIASIIGNLKEDEDAYAKYFDLKPVSLVLSSSDVNIFNELTRMYYGDYLTGKDECVRYWLEKLDLVLNNWKNEYSHKKQTEIVDELIRTVFTIDVSDICEKGQYWYIETFCKGLLYSNLFSEIYIKYIVLLNCSDFFMSIFLKTYLYSDDIKEDMHIYLSGQNIENEMYIAGKNKNQIKKNVMQHAFSRRRLEFDAEKSAEETSGGLIDVVPFDVLVSRKKEVGKYNKTLFDEYIEIIGEKELVNNEKAGYKLTDAHVRLGSKVHLDSFYEISIFFQKPSIARKIAFGILRHLCDKNHCDYDLKEDGLNEFQHTIWDERILFYGYSSYTRMILESMIELAKKICPKTDLDWEFAIYQNDIAIQKKDNDVSPENNIFYSKNSLENIEELEKYKIIQIVPISTSLTTFKKMKGELEDVLSENRDYQSIDNKIIANYTIFWVRNIKEEPNQEEDTPTDIEKTYWSQIINGNIIVTKLITPNPIYYSSVRSHWRDPLICEDCYPDHVLDEKALIETDVTSTIPSIQYTDCNKQNKEMKNDNYENELRILELKSSLRFGHIYRENNHFQYYFDTNEFFVSNRKNIEKWLRTLKDKQFNKVNNNELNIIVTPLHHTNAGFCQCVNNTYYNGTANIIFFDAAKEYKTNVLAKFGDVKETIKHAKELGAETKFIYVDDNIITGTAFRRINNLIQALVGDVDKKSRINRIDEVFVLLNRMSSSSLCNFVEDPELRFHSYVNLDISSIRNYGTSCVLCGLKRNAGLFYRRSSTKSISEYWNLKTYVYQETPFAAIKKDVKELLNSEDGFFRMLCAHVAGRIYKAGFDNDKMFEEILRLFEDLDNANTPIYKYLVSDKNRAIKAFLKVLARPFFIFGKTFKQCMLDFLLLLTECLIDSSFEKTLNNLEVQEEESDNSCIPRKSYLYSSQNKEKFLLVYNSIKNNIKRSELSLFVTDYLLEGLTDIRSNYVIRKKTLIKLCRFINAQGNISDDEIDKFFKAIKINIHRLINLSSDETKTLWLEYLLSNGNEYKKGNDFLGCRRPEDFLPGFVDGVSEKVKKAFYAFWDDIYIDNVRLYYDGTQHIIERMADDEIKKLYIERVTNSLADDYYFNNFRKLINLHCNVAYPKDNTEEYKKKFEIEQKKQIQILVEFLLCLKLAREKGTSEVTDIHKRYEKLYQAMYKLIWTDGEEKEKRELEIVVEGNIGINKNEYYSLRKESENSHWKVYDAINRAKLDEHYKNTGFFISFDEGYIVIAIQNNYEYLYEELRKKNITKNVKIKESRIAPVFIYIKTSEIKSDKRLSLEIIRRILMFKHQLLHVFEQDFNNNSIDDLMKNKVRNDQLARDKAGDHSNSQDLTSIQYLLQSDSLEQEKDMGYWFLLKTYVNMRIARLFRWAVNDVENSLYDIGGTIDDSEINKQYFEKGTDTDFWHKPLKNLYDIFIVNYTEEHMEMTSKKNNVCGPRNYFSQLDKFISVDFIVYGKKYEDVKLSQLNDEFKKIECIEEEKLYYRSEYISCIILDIIFSAINNYKNWEMSLLIVTPEIMMMDLFRLMNKSDFKDKIPITFCIEKGENGVDYLTIRNIKYFESEDDYKKLLDELDEIKHGENTKKGLSLWTIKQYVERIWDKKPPLSVDYDCKKIDGKYCFITKLPIIKGEKKYE